MKLKDSEVPSQATVAAASGDDVRTEAWDTAIVAATVEPAANMPSAIHFKRASFMVVSTPWERMSVNESLRAQDAEVGQRDGERLTG